MKKSYLLIMILITLMLSGCGKNGNAEFTETDTVAFHDLTVEIPKVFVKDNENSHSDMVFYTYNDEEKYNICMLYLNISDFPNNDLKESIKDGMLGKTDFTYNEKDINGHKWAIGYREQSVKSNKTYYVINKNGKEYALNYDDFGSGDKCAEALKIIENSLKFN